MATEGVSKRMVRRALEAPRRRLVLDYLTGCEEPVSVEELAVGVVVEETGASPERVTPEQCGPVRISLERSHLPALHGLGFVDWDSRAGTVQSTTRADDGEADGEVGESEWPPALANDD
ncbi:hypothetical protein ACFO0N_14895 [Halobium salinum]|uniref:DUF7344 domain-containing protein n=1 Tax=Halobium salinum TaxID=1364940 RepID=A0ABD5PEC3_9EURY|nr:hypothetical protein [Halobium salinum]